MNFVDFHTHTPHPGTAELVSAPVHPEGAAFWSLELHPWHCTKLPDDFEARLNAADALGEIGFDKGRGVLPYPEMQIDLWISALEIAVKLHKPVVIHAVGSFELLFQTVRPYIEKVHFLYHGFSKKNPDLLAQLTRAGFFVSLSPGILENGQIREYCAKNPVHLGLESDDSGIPVEELYKRFALPEFAKHAELNWKEFWKNESAL